MRVLMTSWAGRSHYYALVALGWALRSAGHDVRVATQPGFTGVVEATGLSAVPVGRDLDVGALLKQNLGARVTGAGNLPDRWTGAPSLADKARRGLGHFVTIAETMADDTIAYARHWRPDLVVFEPTTFAGPLAAREIGVPAIRHLWAADFLHQLGDIEPLLLGDLLERYGHPSIGVLGDLTIDPCPAPVQVDVDYRRQPVRHVPFNGPAVEPAWLREPPARPRICVTYGQSMSELGIHTGVTLPDVLDAAAGLDVEVIAPVTPAQRAAVDRVPANARLVDPVALHLLLPSCAAVVHHGGAGSMMTALAAGVPQVVLPHMPDLAFNGRRMAGSGAAICLPAAEATPESVTGALRAVLDPARAAAAAHLREVNEAQPTLPEVVDQLTSSIGTLNRSR